MKLQIDTKAKTIKIDENVKINELIKVLKRLLPKEWQEYTLESNAIINWHNPIPWYPYQPWKIGDPWVITCAVGTMPQPEPGETSVYNIEVMNENSFNRYTESLMKS
jgi:hypothetical protein